MPLVCPDCMTEVDPALVATCPKCGHSFSSGPNDETIGYSVARLERSAPIPPIFGRYRVIGQLGAGGFGVVYRAFDEELERDVAVKVPHPHRLESQKAVETYLAEARNLASVDHPGIVPVYDVGQTSDGRCYLVSKFIDGSNLSDRIRLSSLSHVQSVRIVLRVASALHHAHQRGLIHRDVKPSNILLDRAENPFLTDFGLALREEDIARADNVAGTPAYMSPEQLRRETHRIDARTDVYSLGAVLYELLAGSWPLHGKSIGQLREQIMRFEVPPLRAVDAAIPTAIERICHKALAGRSADRYSTAIDLAEDLEQSLPALEPIVAAAAPRAARDGMTGSSVRASVEGTPSMPAPGTSETIQPAGTGAGSTVGAAGSTSLGLETPLRIVPKGLRSFDTEDADFFLELLPGPFDREGLPESVRFWKTRIEQTDADQTFNVALIYGPSGCGKSSLVKAGLLPRLAEHVTPLYLETTPEDTEARLLGALRRRVALLPDDLPLKDTLAAIRRGMGPPPGRKVILVLDQFEQWLHAHRDSEAPELLRALRQCDGGRLQCVLLVRDDFWMAITRFMHALEVKLVEGHNSAGVDLFSRQHARKVLAAFGRAFGCLPPTDEALNTAHKGFLRDAVKGLARDGKVISVRLALFADMVKNKVWSPATLKEVGGTEGIGLTFLEETFSAAHAPPQHRVHERAARHVLRALLPDKGSNIKGQMHAREELLVRSGYANRPDDFDELINILDGELRLVTPADPEAVLGGEDEEAQPGAGRAAVSGKYYQLTHDYLVPSVRRWLVHKQRQTRRGRAELLLGERSATWNVRPQRRYLPSWWQWHRIKLLTNKKDWSGAQRKMMRAAAWYHQTRTVVMAALLVLLSWGGLEGFAYLTAQKLRDQVLYVKTADLPGLIPQLLPYRRWANPLLRSALAKAAPNTRQQLNARLALLPVDPSQADALYGRLLECDMDVFFVLRNALFEHRGAFSDRLWSLLNNASADEEYRLRAAMLLARYSPPQETEFAARWEKHAAFLAQQLHRAVVAEPARYNALTAALTPVRRLLLDPLYTICRDTRLSDSERSIGVNLVLEYATDRPDLLADVLLAEGDIDRAVRIIDRLAATPAEAIALLEPELAKREEDLKPHWNDPPPGTFPAPEPALVQKIVAATGMLADHFAFCQTMALEDFLTVAEGLRGTGFRPMRFRPYGADADVRVAAVWTRDERPWSIDHGLTQEEIRKQISGDRMKDDLLHDLAAYYDETGQLRYTATWSTRQPDDPEAIAFAGEESPEWQSFANNDAAGFSFVTNHLLPTAAGSLYYTFVFWKTSQVDRTWINHSPKSYADKMRDDYAEHLLVDVNVTAEPIRSPAEARRAEYAAAVANAEQALRADPAQIRNWYDRGFANFRAGNDADAIRDFTHFLENGGEEHEETWRPEHGHKWRIAAAARMGVEQTQLDEYVRQGDAFHDNNTTFALFHRALAAAHGPDVHEALDEFEQHVAELQENVWRHFYLVRSYAFASDALRDRDPALSQLYADRAIAHLQQTVSTDVRHVSWVRTYPLTDSLRDDPRYPQIAVEVELKNIDSVRLARGGDATRARASLQTYLNGTANLQQKARRAAIVAAFLGDDEAGMRKLESDLAGRPNHQALRFNAAFAYSVASYALAEAHPDRAARYADRAVELLSLWIHDSSFTATRNRLRRMLGDWHCHPIREHPGFKELVAELDCSYTGVFHLKVDFESQEVRERDPAKYLRRCRELASMGFRAVAIGGATISFAADGTSVFDAASVWHKPRVTEAQRDEFARRQATATVALTRLGDVEKAWPLLKSSPQPRVRTFLMNQLSPLGTDPKDLVSRLGEEQDPSARRALILALGQYADELLSPTDRDTLVEQVVEIFRNDADPGVHSAAEWLLRRWGHADELDESTAELATTEPETDRRWFVTPAGHTMVVIDGPVEFDMGSTVREPNRDADEVQHRRRIDRSFAIATKEVTVEQFQRFLRAHPQIEHSHRRSHSPELDCPVGTLTWYQVAQYCRWLSEREGLPEEEMCYPPVDEIKPGMRMKPFYLTRSGYRVPTEAEWEYACRAGTTTPRYYGYSDALLSKYAWHKDVAENRSWPVGTLLPNEFGLFDMYGNAKEFCHEHLVYPDELTANFVDDALPTALETLPIRISLRGGSVLHDARWMRSADRFNDGTSGFTKPQRHFGFRVARTFPPAELLAARAQRRDATQHHESGDAAEADQAQQRAEASYDKLIAIPRTKEVASWELAESLLDRSSRWTLLEPSEMNSSGGATLELQSDGSVLAGGLNPDDDSYTIVAHTDLVGIRAIRLEAIPDASHPNGAIGRYPSNGNFHLSEFTVSLRSQESAVDETPVSIRRGFADYALPDFDVERALDGNQVTFWDLVPHQQRRHVAVFESAHPVGGPDGATLVIKLDFTTRRWDQHNLGRFRLWVTNDPATVQAERIRMNVNEPKARLAAASYHAGNGHRVITSFTNQQTVADHQPVVIEAELFDAIEAPWRVYSDPLASGGRYLMAPNGTGGGTGSNKRLQYNFRVPHAGDYRLVARAHGPNGSDDSLFVSIDGATPVFWGINARGGWDWVTHPDSFTLSTGIHTIQIGVREDGTRLDKFILTNDPSFDPRPTHFAASLYDPLLLSLACSQLGRHEVARQHLNESLNWMGTHLPDATMQQLAGDALAAVLAHEPGGATWLSRRAAMAALDGQTDEAIALYLQLVRSEPVNEEWSRRLGQLQPDVAAFWNFDFGYDDWRPGNQCRVSLSSGALRVDTTGADPFITATIKAPAGWFELALRVRLEGQMPAQVYWGTHSGLTFDEPKSVPTTLQGSSEDWMTQKMYFRSTEPLTFLRLDLGDRADATIDIDAITLRRLGDEPEAVASVLTEIIESEPHNSNALLRRAALFDALGRRDESHDDYAKALAASAPGVALVAEVEEAVAQRPLVATSEREPVQWRYRFTDPGDGWQGVDFTDNHWSTGPGPFGDWRTFATQWETSDIWLRREFELGEPLSSPSLHFRAFVDEQVQIYLNGVLAAEGGWVGAWYQRFDCTPNAVATLRAGNNVLAVHCSNTLQGALIDVGLYWDDRDGLLRVYDNALAAAPDRAELRVARGDLHTRAESWAKAVEDYNRAVTNQTQDAELIAKRAEAYYQLDQWEPSLADWTRALELKPDVVEYLRKRAFCNRNLRQRGKARADWTALTKLRPGNAWFRLQLAFSYNRSRRWENALADHNEAIAIAGDNQPWHFRFHRGGHWAQRGLWDQAAEDFRYVQDNAPDDYFEGANWWVGRDLAMLFVVAGEHDRFERAAERLLATFADTDNPEIADWVVKACVLAPVNQQRAEALSALEQRSSHFPDLQSALEFRAGALDKADARLADQSHAAAYFLRALIDQGRGDTQTGLDWFERGQRATVAEEAAAETRRPFAFWQQWAFTVALQKQARTQLDARLADLTRADVADPEKADLHFARGIVYKSLARDTEALADFDQAIARNANMHAAWFCRGQVQAALGRQDEALSDFSKAIELHADRLDYFVARGNLHAQRESWQEAAEDYSHAMTPHATDVELIVKRAAAYEKLEQWENAVGDWTRALELRPDNAEYLTRRARCHSWRLANHGNAIEDWTRLIELRENDPWLFMERAGNYVGLNRWEPAMADYERAVEISDADSRWRCYFLRGSHWARRGEWQKAADDLARSFSLPPRDWGAWEVAREHALLRMMVDDLDGYRQAAEVLQQRTADDMDVVQLRWLVYVLLLDPEGIDPAGRDRLISLVDRLATDANAWWAPRLKAAILFRTGDVEAATQLFEQNPGGPTFQFLAAMAHDQLGHADRANELLDESSVWIEQQRDNDPDKRVPKGSFTWHDWVVYLVLQRQARGDANAGDSGGSTTAEQS